MHHVNILVNIPHVNPKNEQDCVSKSATSMPGQQVATHKNPNLAEEVAQRTVTEASTKVEQEFRQVRGNHVLHLS